MERPETNTMREGTKDESMSDRYVNTKSHGLCRERTKTCTDRGRVRNTGHIYDGEVSPESLVK